MKTFLKALPFFFVIFLLMLTRQNLYAQSITLSSPTSSATYVDSVSTLYSITGDASAQQVQVVWTYTSGNPAYVGQAWTLTMKTASLSQSFKFKPTDLTNSANVFTAAPTSAMPEGFYSVYAQYIRPVSAGSLLVRTTTRTNVYVDLYTQTPVLKNPPSNGASSTTIYFKDSIPELYLSGSKKLIFSGATTDTLKLADNVLKDSTYLHTSNFHLDSTYVQTYTSSSLPDGTYSVTLQYQDRYAHPVASAVNTNFLVQTSTPAPSFVTPIDNIKMNNPSQYSYLIPSKPLSGTALLTLISDSGMTYTFPLSSDTISGTFNLPAGIKTTAPSGTYTVDLRYRDFLSNPYDSVEANNVTLDFETQTPILTLPTSLSEFSDSMNVRFTIPESYTAYTVKLIFYKSGTDSAVNTLTLNNVTIGTDSFDLHTKNLLNPSIIASLNSDSLADGAYDMVVSYQDSLGNPTATSAVVSSVVIDSRTLTPTILQPVASTTHNLIPIQYLLPEAAYPGSVKMIFTGAGVTDTLGMINTSPRSTAFLDPNQNPAGSGAFVSATLDTLPDGVYTVQLSYQDAFGNPAATVTINSVTVDTHTQVPFLILPASPTTVSNSMDISYTLPEAASTASLVFMGRTTDTITVLLNANATTAGTHSFTVNTKNITNYANISSVSPNNLLNDDVYTIELVYSDLLGNPDATAIADSVTVDTKTLPAVLSSPVNNGVISSTALLNLSFSLPENALSSSVRVTFTGTGTSCTATLNADTAGSYSFAINPDSISLSTGISNPSANSLADGSYSVTVSYQDALGNAATTSNAGSFILDRVTKTPSIILPAASSTSNATMNVSFYLPEAAFNNTVHAQLSGADTITFNFITSGTGVQNYTLNCTNLSASTGVSNASVSKIPNGVYTFLISYQDTIANPSASASALNVGVDVVTGAPSLISPAASSTVAEQMNVKFIIPQTPLNGSVKMLFAALGISDTLVLKNISLGTDSFTLDTKNLTASAFVQSSTMNSLSSGIYTITLSYQDSSADPAASAFVTNVNLDNTTQAPVLISPADSSVIGQNMTVVFNLPDAPESGSVNLIFNSAGFNDTLTLANVSAGINSFTLNTKNIFSSSHIFSARPSIQSIQNGVYTITLSYQDYLGNVVAGSSVTGVNLNNITVTPTLTAPVNNQIVSTDNATFALSFLIPEVPLTNSVQVLFSNGITTDTASINISAAGTYSLTIDPEDMNATNGLITSTSNSLTDGAYNVVIEYRNALGDPVASSNAGTMILDHVTLSPTLIYPGSSSTNNSLVNVSFNLPENASNNTATLTLSGVDTISLSLQTVGNGLQRFTLNGNNLAATFGLISTTQSTIYNGIYSVSLSYQDTLNNPAARTSQTDVAISGVTPPPVVTTTTINTDCNTTADLRTAITSDTDNLTVTYYSDAAFTAAISNHVNGAGTYYVKVTNTFGLSDSSSIVVTSTPTNPPAPAAAGTTVCNGSSALLTASGTGTISWYDAATNGNWLGSGNNYTTAALTGNATFFVQDSTCVSSASRTVVNITVNALPANTTSLITGGVSADQTGAVYQWLNCNSNYAPISGQQDQYIQSGNGNYAVMITLNGCTDTSACVDIINTAVNEIKGAGSISIYPNPVSDRLVIENKENSTKTVFEIFNSVGKLVFNGTFFDKTTVETTDLSVGVYLIRLENDNNVQFKKFVKE